MEVGAPRKIGQNEAGNNYRTHYDYDHCRDRISDRCEDSPVYAVGGDDGQEFAVDPVGPLEVILPLLLQFFEQNSDRGRFVGSTERLLQGERTPTNDRTAKPPEEGSERIVHAPECATRKRTPPLAL